MSHEDPPLVTASVTLRKPEFTDRKLVLPIRVEGEWNVGDRHGELSGREEVVISGEEFRAVREYVESALAVGSERGVEDGDDRRET